MALFGFGVKQMLDEVKKYTEEGNYEAAAEAADRIPEQKLKTASEFNILGRAYKKNEDYLQAKQMFERSYEERCSRVTLLDLLDCCLEIKDLESAEKYFDEYHKVSPEDKTTLYVYRYKIEKRKGRERRLLISILEELKAVEYLEEYAYELAKQYHKQGMARECMQECQDIILWFGAGATVERAKALLAYYKGELSLDDIKSAGARYVAKQQELMQGMEETEEALEEEERTECPQTPEYEAAEVYEEAEEYAEPEEYAEAERYVEPDEYAEPEEEVEAEGSSEPEECVETMPEEKVIESEERPENGETREDNELFVPMYEPVRIENAKLAKLLKEKKVSLLDEVKNFARVESVQKQLVKSMELVLNDREKAYFVITGEKKTGKTTFAFSLVRLLYRLGIVKYDRTATIHAVQLNQISIADYKEQLKNCNLIIENAGGMTQETIEDILRFSKGRKGSICVILEDTTRNINKLLRGREDLNSLFNNRIHLGKYSANDLLGFAYDYIEKEDYGIDKMAAEVLSKKIDKIVRTSGDDQRLLMTLELAANAIAHAEKRNSEILLGMAREGRFREGNYLVIVSEDVEATP